MELYQYKNSGGTIVLVTHDESVGVKADRIISIQKSES